ncbi:LysR family transcriptional regulator [Cupriavidus gilardii]|uniref:LysR family transcriptional regulator n=1 Tax=Cupriavidus gilardii TaxID=82541 RepID=A0A6N1BMK4_9BURK|nr:LysR family transcriptional regulator [Cupriavidus gilardii]QQE06506.1 LysR family transcriptional regulator [Cupriavidus sp. ISTL7]KAB0593840.1 LysR family transcriptional regulator [Cupriavidus gilardii]MCT9012742.1 LysR family transcriptional regulator [Cupriavidus gilardii]MCT9054708.1 LysR family transcriptional regulator [Cupriavidus gilardii]MCT9074749.1 LysR family transcriptional regulator [Cupriavidus gilardii]
MVNVDTKLLVIFTELLSKRNATYVAEKMHMTAPAVSHSLGRLREIFDDPLFIRVPHGLTPTPRALELGPKIREMLDLWSSINEGDVDNFDPAVASGTLHIGFAAELGDTVFNRFVLRLAQLAPELHIRLVESQSWEADVASMRANELDLAFCALPTGHPEIVEETVASLNLWVCARKGHPLLQSACTLDHYLECGHIFMASAGGTGRPAPSLIPLDYALQQRGLKRNAALTVHSWRAQAELAAQTDMIFTVNALTKDVACESYGLNAFPLPAEIQTTLGLNMFWHRSRNTHPMLVWARGLFRQVVAEFVGVPVPGLPQRMAEIEREQV